jgi:hypothetical protein
MKAPLGRLMNFAHHRPIIFMTPEKPLFTHCSN